MNKVHNLSLENVKCYRKVDLELRSFTIITGTNSSGKSSLLQSILLFYSAQNRQLIDFHNIHELDLISYRSVLNNSADAENFKIGVNGDYIEFDEYLENGVPLPNLANLKSVSDRKETISLVLYIGSDRQICGTQVESVPNNAYSPSQNNSGIAEYIYRRQNSLTRTEFQSDIQYCLNYLDFGKDILLIKYGSFYSIYIDGININHVGTGIRYALPIIVSLISNKEAILIIENPEIHLHPSAQSKLLEIIAEYAMKNSLQVIMETHSDHVLNSLRVLVRKRVVNKEDVLIKFTHPTRNDTELLDIHVLEDGSIETWPDGFFDELDKKLEQLLW